MPTIPFHAVAEHAPRPARLRRSYLAVPGSSAKMMAKAANLPADAVFFDLEDAVAPAEKITARALVIEALTGNDYGDALRVVRVNGVTTRWCHDDIVALVRSAHAHVDCLMIPKVEHAGQVWFVEHLLAQLEAELLDDGAELMCAFGGESGDGRASDQVGEHVTTQWNHAEHRQTDEEQDRFTGSCQTHATTSDLSGESVISIL